MKNWLQLTTLIVLIALSFQTIFAQASSDTAMVKIPTIDMRGQDPLMASAKSIVESRKDVVVVLIRGGSNELIKETKNQLKALVHRGYNRLGIILCDINPGEAGAVVGVVSNGTSYAAVKDAKPTTLILWQIYSLVRDAYQEHILPKIKNSQSQKN